MKTFKDLKFGKHPISNSDNEYYKNGKHAIMNFDNGYGISVVFGKFAYSNGIDTYEAAVLFNGEITYNTHITDDVKGYLSEIEVTEMMKQIQNYNIMKIQVNKTTTEEVDITLPYFFKTEADVFYCALISDNLAVVITDTDEKSFQLYNSSEKAYRILFNIKKIVITEHEFFAKYDEVNEINNNLINKYR